MPPVTHRTHAEIMVRLHEIEAATRHLRDKTDKTDADREAVADLLDEFRALNATRLDMEHDAALAEIREAAARGDVSRISASPVDDDALDALDARGAGQAAGGGGHRFGASLLYRGDPWAVAGPLEALTSLQLRGRAITAVERAPGGMPAAAKERAVRALENDDEPSGDLARYVIEASRPDYLRAFAKVARDPFRGHLEWSDAERAAFTRAQVLTRAMNLSNGAAGGYLVPFQLDPAVIVTNTGSVNPLRQIARVVLTAANEWRGITSAGVVASWDAEAAEVSDDSPTLGNPPIVTAKGQAYVQASVELIEDSSFAAQVGPLMADAKAQLEAPSFVTGTGAGQPKGFVAALSAVAGSVLASGASAMTMTDVIALQNALPARWRARATWTANLSILNVLRQLPLYPNGPALLSDATDPPRMLGWQAREVSAMDGTVTASANDYLLACGDFSQYVIADRVGSIIEFVPTVVGPNRRPTSEKGWLLHWRTGADVVVPDAFRLLNLSA